MKTTSENQTRRTTANPSNMQKATSQKTKVEKTQQEDASTYVDLDKANFADRKHGRTAEPLGPDHEPGTV